MRDYAQFSSSFWTGETGKLLRTNPDAQRLAAYLFTSPHHNLIGFYFLPIQYASYETGIPLEACREALAWLSEKGFAHYDETTEMVWVVNMAREQLTLGEQPWAPLAANDNRGKACRKAAEKAKRSTLYAAFLERYGHVIGLSNHNPLRTHFEPPSKPSAATPFEGQTDRIGRTGTGEGSGTGTRKDARARGAFHSPDPTDDDAPPDVEPPTRPAAVDILGTQLLIGAVASELSWPAPELTHTHLRQVATRVAKVGVERGISREEAGRAIALAAMQQCQRTGTQSQLGFVLLSVDPWAPAPVGQPLRRGGRMEPTRGTTAEDYQGALPIEEQQRLAKELRANRKAAANGQ